MANQNAARDQNQVPVLLGIDDTTGETRPILTDSAGNILAVAAGAGGTGTVTSVSVTTANGVSGSVATATTTPAITLTLGAITPTSVNGLTISTTTGTFTLTNAKTFAVTNTLTLSGTDSTVMTFPSTSATIARTDAANTFTGASTASAWVLTSPTITTKISPTTDDGAPLGDTTHNFSDLFLATGAVINFQASNVVITHTSGVLTMGTGDLRVTTAGTNAASVVTVGGTQTLTAKTLTTPTIADLSNATHGHTNAAGGGQLNATSIFSAGTVPTARLGSGTADATTFLRGDQTWAVPSAGGGTDMFSGTNYTRSSITLASAFTTTLSGSGAVNQTNLEFTSFQTGATGTSKAFGARPDFLIKGFSKNISIRAMVSFSTPSTNGKEYFLFGNGESDASFTKYAGVRVSLAAAVWKAEAICKDGTTETATDITSALSTAGTKYIIDVIFTSGTNVLVKVNGTTAATLSTNLPPAADTTSSVRIVYGANNGGDASNNAVQSYWDVVQSAF